MVRQVADPFIAPTVKVRRFAGFLVVVVEELIVPLPFPNQGRRVAGGGHMTDRIDAKAGDQYPRWVGGNDLRLHNLIRQHDDFVGRDGGLLG